VTAPLTAEAVQELARARGFEWGLDEAAEIRDQLESIRAELAQAETRLGRGADEPATVFEPCP